MPRSAELQESPSCLREGNNYQMAGAWALPGTSLAPPPGVPAAQPGPPGARLLTYCAEVFLEVAFPL